MYFFLGSNAELIYKRFNGIERNDPVDAPTSIKPLLVSVEFSHLALIISHKISPSKPVVSSFPIIQLSSADLKLE
jgi:hypothetical protein